MDHFFDCWGDLNVLIYQLARWSGSVASILWSDADYGTNEHTLPPKWHWSEEANLIGRSLQHLR